jgi:hypothetical protein
LPVKLRLQPAYILAAPDSAFWTRSKQPWIMLPEGDQVFETQPAT